jgi:hypothetical protein
MAGGLDPYVEDSGSEEETSSEEEEEESSDEDDGKGEKGELYSRFR